jgi:hypothetical protein
MGLAPWQLGVPPAGIEPATRGLGNRLRVGRKGTRGAASGVRGSSPDLVQTLSAAALSLGQPRGGEVGLEGRQQQLTDLEQLRRAGEDHLAIDLAVVGH